MEKPSYYAVLPANVRYDQQLTPNAKLLYGEITALTNKEGFCWASDSYFAQLYNVHRNTINGWVQQLKLYQYITIELEYKEDSKEIKQRKIYLNTHDTLPMKSPIPIGEITYTPIGEKTGDNNTSNLILNNNNVVVGFKDFWEIYPKKTESSQIPAYQEWSNLNPDSKLVKTILEAINKFKLSDWKKENGRYIPKPDKFLRERQWERIIKDMPKVEIIDEQRRQTKEACRKKRLAILKDMHSRNALSDFTARRYFGRDNSTGSIDDVNGTTQQ